ncbi:hypothetical protein SAMN06264365_12136 [Actinoplanes regularis]|uniref:Uncharacterized protein n=1 Tax=Actinoplanes regularis TaxID=52697 RepID=A0A239GHX8_9ACTN|nr:hypothetical protein [Actinoplanes regularis]GIE90621.1 hypothetical protein Are01nite_71010 [Actinoplanes regularis]SNS68631.1 hypothetical protein SAMN06264365_12136 [Actinoplanes regularis]
MSDLKAFRRVCYEAARLTGGTVTEFRISTGVTPNFHQGIIAFSDRFVSVLCVRDASLLAVAVPRVIEPGQATECGPLTFIDSPELAAVLAQTPGFRLLTTAELNGPVDVARWPGICLTDMRYWRPGSLGEALFNYWD